jgi:ligand-binding sensor domain-containing protein/AraC-like DNA-binding protein
MSNGLSDLLVNVIYKDSAGFVWLGTDNSLDRFDGVNIKNWQFDGVDVKRKRVNAIVETDREFLWIGNGAGLWVLNRRNSIMSRVFPEIMDIQVWSMIYGNDNLLYIGTDKGLYIVQLADFNRTKKMSGENFKHVLVDSNILSPANRIKKILTDDAGVVWLATSKGLYSYLPEKDSLQSHFMGEFVPREDEYRTMTRIDRMLYLGTESQGLFSYDMDKGIFERFIDVGSGVISSLSSDGEDNLYVATDGSGICCISHKDRKILYSYRHDARDKSSIRSNSVYSLLVDREGILWIGFYSAGLDYSLFQNDLFDVYSHPPFFDSNNLPVRSFYINGHEKLIGTRDGLYYINEATGQVRVFKTPVLRSDLILSIGFFKGKYYIGTYGGGLYVLDPLTLALNDFPADNSFIFRKGHIFSLSSDNNGNLWIGTSEGVYCYSGGNDKPRIYNSTNSQMPEGNVYDVFFDSSGKGWICTDRGLCIFDTSSGSIKSNVFPNEFPVKEKFRMVYEDSSKNLYFLPDKGNVFVTNLSMSSFGNMFAGFGKMYGNAHKSVIEDNNGYIWLGGDVGLLRIRTDGSSVNVFGFNDGLPAQTFMDKAVYKDENGILWFGNSKGLVFVCPDKVDSMLKVPYRIVFTDVFVNGHMLDGERWLSDYRLLLGEKENNLTFRFVNLSYSDPSTTTYEYMLDGYSDEWSLLSAHNEVSYYDMPSGKYIFRVRIPGDEISEITMNIIVKKPYTLWFWLALFVVILSLLIYIIFKSRRKIPRQNQISRIKNPPEQDLLPDHRNETSFENTEKDASDMSGGKQSRSSDEKYKSNRLSGEECKELYEKLASYMKAEKPYTNQDLKISDIAQALGVSSPVMSFLFNQYLHQSYYDYINEYRVAEFKRLVSEPEYSRYTLSALAELCGFSSRASFFRSFKKITGITPNEYINSVS